VKRGPKPKGTVEIKWSPNFAYAIGLLTTDGCLSPDGRHIDLTSKDEEQIHNFINCLGLKNKIGIKFAGNKKITSNRVQFGDVLFYKFLLDIGLTPNKSKVLEEIKIPEKYFFDFLRGHFDGDGTFYSYIDKRWKSSFMFYMVFVSASEKHINWLRNKIKNLLKTSGSIVKSKNNSCYQLRYAKKESLKLIDKIYYSKNIIFLKRKSLKINKVLSIISPDARVL